MQCAICYPNEVKPAGTIHLNFCPDYAIRTHNQLLAQMRSSDRNKVRTAKSRERRLRSRKTNA